LHRTFNGIVAEFKLAAAPTDRILENNWQQSPKPRHSGLPANANGRTQIKIWLILNIH
jgi:hypothetical protein